MTEQEEFEFRARLEAEQSAPAPKGLRLGKDMEAVAQERPWETGIATAASKGVRGLGTLLLPKAAAAWAEKKGFLPTEQDIQLLEQGTGSSGKAQLANIGGEIALTALPGAGAYKVAGKMLPKAAGQFTRAATGGAAAGGAGSAVMGDDPEAGAALGAVLGPAGIAIGNTGGWVWKNGKRLWESADTGANRYVRELSDNPVADAAKLRALKPEVSGEQVTSGMAATVDPKMLYMKELQEQAARRNGGAALAVDQANEAARAAPLERMAAPGQRSFNPNTRKTEPSYAEELISRVTGPIYGRAMPDRVEVDPVLRQVLQGAEVMPARAAGARQFAQEQTNAAAGGRAVPAGRAPYSEQPVMRDSSTGATMGDGPFMPTKETYSIEELQLVRKNLDDKITHAVEQGDDMTVRRLSTARRQLTGEMAGQSGNFGLANTTFKNLSEPQNQAQIAQVYLNALRSPAGKERASSFLAARQNAPQTIKRGDQSPRFQHEGEILTSDQLKEVDAVTRSLRRQSDYDALPRMELPGLMAPAEVIESGIPGYLSKVTTTVKKVLNKVGIQSDEAVRKVIDEAALDPNKMAKLLESVPPSDRMPLLSAIREMNPRGASIGVVGGQI